MTRAVHQTRSAASPGAVSAIPPATDQAWRLLERTGKSISEADTKAGLILGAAGVASGALFSIVRGIQTPTAWTVVVAIACAAQLLACALCAGMGVFRDVGVASTRPASSTSTTSPGCGPDPERSTRPTSVKLLGQPERLTRELGLQIWETSHVAAAKYGWIDRALILLLGALIALSATALIATVTTLGRDELHQGTHVRETA